MPSEQKASFLRSSDHNPNLEVVTGYTDQELIGWVHNSGSSDWSAKPSFFDAVKKEVRKRGVSRL